jgi:hypothetical protein
VRQVERDRWPDVAVPLCAKRDRGACARNDEPLVPVVTFGMSLATLLSAMTFSRAWGGRALGCILAAIVAEACVADDDPPRPDLETAPNPGSILPEEPPIPANVISCPGTDPVSTGYGFCRTDRDCHGNPCTRDPIPVHGIPECLPSSACVQDSACDGGICEPGPPGSPYEGCSFNVCGPGCTADSCPAGKSCEMGRCKTIMCTAGYACSSGLTCEPGGALGDEHGCVPTRCGDNGYVCDPTYVCSGAANADPHGCAPVDCDQGYVCPAGTLCNKAHPVPGAAPDPHGCRPTRCDEAPFDCPPNFICEKAAASPDGCRALRCDEAPFDCPPNFTCEKTKGCIRKGCAADSDCDCGLCISKVCEDRAWVCNLIPY